MCTSPPIWGGALLHDDPKLGQLGSVWGRGSVAPDKRPSVLIVGTTSDSDKSDTGHKGGQTLFRMKSKSGSTFASTIPADINIGHACVVMSLVHSARHDKGVVADAAINNSGKKEQLCKDPTCALFSQHLQARPPGMDDAYDEHALTPPSIYDRTGRE